MLARIAEDGRLSGSRLDPEVSLSPLVSVVVPCYRVNERYFEEMLESVLAQSYVRWELVLVDSECESSKVPGIVERIADDRITVVCCATTSASWATRTPHPACAGRVRGVPRLRRRVGAECAGAYVQAVAEHPDAGLLYCDEDSFEVAGAFKNLCSRLISTEICCTRTIASRIGSWCARTFWPRRACPTTR